MTDFNLSEIRSTNSRWRSFYRGAADIMPLSIAVLPWGVLAGSMAIQAGLSDAKALGMSAIVFAGAAQLVSLGLIVSGASVVTIIVTVFFLTSQHFIYALNFRKEVGQFPLSQRLLVGFLLTDELFAIGSLKREKLTFCYMFGAGGCFYLAWCLFSALGIFLANIVPDLQSLHLDFSIIAVFILIVVPMVKKIATFVGVIVSVFFTFCFKYMHIETGIVLAGIIGMFVATLVDMQLTKRVD
nr:AzlC family ABC transporter permease [Acinetobacter sp. Marseille-Q1620]